MKKYTVLALLLVTFISLLLLTACADASPEPTLAPPPTPAATPTPTPEPTPEPEILFVPLSQTMVEVEFHDLILTLSEDLHYEFASDEMLEIFYTDEDFPRTRVIHHTLNTTLDFSFAENIFNGLEHTPTGDIQIFTVNGNEAFIQHFVDSGNNPFVLAFLVGNRVIYAVNFVADPDGYDFFHAYFYDILDNMQVVDLPTNMLHDDDLFERLVQQTIALEFDGIVEMVDEYLATVNADNIDPAHEIRKLALRGSEVLESVDIVVDDFDGQVTIYYPGIREITSSINVVPYIRPGSASNIRFPRADFFLTMGFVRNGWLFFDRTEFRMVDDFIWWSNHGHFDVNRDVLGGRSIREAVTQNWSMATAGRGSGYLHRLETEMSVDYDHVLRFINRGEDNNFDVTLSDAEVLAVATLAELYNIMGRLAARIPDEYR